jgi:peroxiredoxin
MLRRTTLGAGLALVTAAVLPTTTAHAAATVGQAAPDFTLRDTGGKTVRLSELRGRHVVLEWTNPGCPFVQKHYRSGNLPALQKEAVAKNVVWLAINSTAPDHGDYLSPPQLARWMGEQRAAASATLMDEDGRVGQAYGARTTPHMYLIDPHGRLIYAGGIDSIPSARIEDIARATNHVRQALDEALAGKPVSRPTAPPYGCSIKYAS